MELIKASLMAVAGGGGGNLQTKTFTQNGTYSPDSGYDGFSRVTVDVDDYYDEWQAALAELQEYQECCEDVADKLREYDPDFPDPPVPEEIPEEIDKIAGLDTPPGTPVEDAEDIADVVGGKCKDKDADITVQKGILVRIETTGQGVYEWEFYPGTTSIDASRYAGNRSVQMNYGVYANASFDPTVADPASRANGWCNFTGVSTSPTASSPTFRFRIDDWNRNTGEVQASWYNGQQWTSNTRTFQELAGYGASGHTYKVYN